jgi:protein SCO1/2
VDFVSVDPARDTPEHLAAYFSSFGPRFRGLTGDRAEIDRLVHSFRAAYEHVPTNGADYTVNHTAITYLVNPRGEVVDIIGYGNPHERTVAQLRAFLS